MSEVEAAAAADNDISEAARLEKEAMLTEKMAKMREKNEAIRKRYNEVQEDLKNAQTISSQVKVESGSDDEDRKPVVRKVTNKTPSRDRECKQKFTPRRQNSESSSSQDTGAEQSMQARPVHSFGEGGGPPPDPGYNFLADEERDGPKENKEQQNQQQPQRGRFPRQRGGQRGNRQFQGDNFSRSAMEGGPHDKDQKWREERAAIDEARIRRQQSADGNWRREWDNNKDDTQPQTPQNQNRGGRGRGGDRGSFGGGLQRGGNGTKFFYQQRARGGPHSESRSIPGGDRWVRDTQPPSEGSRPDDAPVRDLRDIINSRRSGCPPTNRGNRSDFQPKPRRDNNTWGSNQIEHTENDDEWEDVE
ncbi:regulator of nonsense transcripts 3B-like isoform X2 [Cloeon dipterum]|uniref:regulator of nonsense transcripts 3B-like isoform X2 n=1 Tax=Cloeon dipterum TaxID=197152 RepID=UPI00321F7B52